MSDNLPTIDIKGKEYVLVKDRVLHFNETYPNGSIETRLVSEPDSQTVIMKALVIPDVEKPTRRFTGYSQAVIGQGMVNTTAAMENAETSAVGRALGFMGIGVVESIASADEMNKALNTVKEVTRVPVEEERDDLIATCPIHDVQMEQRMSKTGNPYWSHRKADNSLCFGK